MENHREKYDVCLSRAVSNLSSLSELCLPFVKVGGCFVPYKSDKSEEEIATAKNAIEILGGHICTKETFFIENYARTLIKIDKIKPTSKKYPRKAGIPAKNPL